MADLGSSSIHDDLVKAVKAHNTEEVTWLDCVGVDFNNLSGSHLKLNTNSLFDKFDIRFFHVGWHMWPNDGPLGVVSYASEESLYGIE